MAKSLNAVEPLPLEGAFVIKPACFEDARGSFCVLHGIHAFSQSGIEFKPIQESLSISKQGVLRGLHYQIGDNAQAKLVRCVRGEAFDVIVDLRKSSATFGKWAGTNMSDANKLAVFVPKGFAHGFLAMTEQVHLLYNVDAPYSPKDERGINYADNVLGIKWPISAKPIVSDKDARLPDFESCEKFE